MGRRRLEKRLEGLTTRAEQAQQERTDPSLHLGRLTDSELELLDRLVARYVDNWGEFEDSEAEIWFVALMAKGLDRRDLIPSDLPPPPELPHPGSYAEETERRGLFTPGVEPSDPRLLEEEGEAGRT